jgi:aminopeptidase N
MPRPPVRETLGYTRWSWQSAKPQATYLASLVIGQYDVTTDTAANGQTVYSWTRISQTHELLHKH